MNMAMRAALALCVAGVGYFGIYRPLQLHWGATSEEVRRVMPGDELQPKSIFNATRATTIHARPEDIWPWLVQIGYRRAGWYGYDWIDNDGIPSSDKILAEWQSLQVGDHVPIWRGIDFPVVAMEPDHYLLFVSADGRESMALALYPQDGSTRLVWRIRLGNYERNPRLIVLDAFTDVSDFIAVRQALAGIKARAEGSYRQTNLLYLELLAWFAMFLGFLASLIALVFRREWTVPFCAAVLTGLFTVLCILFRPPLYVDLICFAVVCASLWSLIGCAQKRMPRPADAEL